MNIYSVILQKSKSNKKLYESFVVASNKKVAINKLKKKLKNVQIDSIELVEMGILL